MNARNVETPEAALRATCFGRFGVRPALLAATATPDPSAPKARRRREAAQRILAGGEGPRLLRPVTPGNELIAIAPREGRRESRVPYGPARTSHSRAAVAAHFSFVRSGGCGPQHQRPFTPGYDSWRRFAVPGLLVGFWPPLRNVETPDPDGYPPGCRPPGFSMGRAPPGGRQDAGAP